MAKKDQVYIDVEDYRLQQYRPGAWCIKQRFVHEKTGEEEWRIIKYPGNLRQAANRLLSLVTGENEHNALSLIERIKSSEDAIIKAISEWASRSE